MNVRHVAVALALALGACAGSSHDVVKQEARVVPFRPKPAKPPWRPTHKQMEARHDPVLDRGLPGAMPEVR